jgi:hypothetical protein
MKNKKDIVKERTKKKKKIVHTTNERMNKKLTFDAEINKRTRKCYLGRKE